MHLQCGGNRVINLLSGSGVEMELMLQSVAD